MREWMSYEAWLEAYYEAADIRDWQTCDLLCEDFPEYVKRLEEYDDDEE